MNIHEKFLTIEEVSAHLKIPKHTLRFWEKIFEGVLVPSRTKGRQRRFNAENIALIIKIKKMRERGMSLTEIRDELNNGHSCSPSNSNHIDQLAKRVADVVKAEVYQFFEIEKGEK
jgi:DNA-binding transcriptional MerR regulator